MKRMSLLILGLILLNILPTASYGKDLPKIAVWDLEPLNTPATHAKNLTSILVSELSKLNKYEVYSQENVRTLAGWTAERMQLGCTDSKCLTALGQMDISKLISGSVGKIGNTYSISLNLFDTQSVRAERSVSDFCRTEDELIPLIQQAVRKLLGVEVTPSKGEEKKPGKEMPVALPDSGKSFKDRYTGMEFVFVKGGCFQMGDTFGDGTWYERPAHEVCVDDFYLGKYEVTQGEWEMMMGNNPSYFKGANYPVHGVNWNGAQDFIDRLNSQTGRRHRLPTEAEWEYAARSGGKKEKYSGTSQEGELGEYCWYSNNSGFEIHPVGQKKSNGLGFYDMSGNVREWCADWYDESYYRNSPKDNPSGPVNGLNRVIRGGHFATDREAVQAASRFWAYQAFDNQTYGFRVALSPQ